MTRVEFASSIARQTTVRPVDVTGRTIGEVFERAFVQQPKLRGYVLDDQGAVRKHVAVFINNETIVDRATLSDAVKEDDCVYVIQALSGG